MRGFVLTEYIVIAFVAVGLIAIAFRFVPRDEHGARRLPRVIDESIGVAAIRSILRRRPAPSSARHAAAAAPADPASAAFAEPSEEEIAYRIGVAGAPAPMIPTRLIVSRGALQAHPPAIPVLPPAPTTPVHGPLPQRRLQAHPASSLGLQRRMAGAVAASVVAIAMLAIVFVPRETEGGVLSATGMPSSLGPNAVGGASSGEPTGSPGPSVSPVPASPSVTASTFPATPTSAAATPTPAATRGPTPTPVRTPKPTPKPPTPAPTPTPTPPPTPTAPLSTPTPTPTLAPTPTPTPDPTPSASAPSQAP